MTAKSLFKFQHIPTPQLVDLDLAHPRRANLAAKMADSLCFMLCEGGCARDAAEKSHSYPPAELQASVAATLS